MRVLLVGEYNRFHNFLKQGLTLLGHHVTVVGLNDGFKHVDVDHKITHYFRKGISKKIRVVLFRLFKFDVHSLMVKLQILKLKQQLQNYDIVQFINESSFLCQPKTEKSIFNLLSRWSGKCFLLSCSCDYPSVTYAYRKKFRYSILNPFFEARVNEKDFYPILKYRSAKFRALHDHIYNTIAGVIASDLDYHLPLVGFKKYLGMIPNPINIKELKYIKPIINNKIIIFHGINKHNYYKKGNDFFEKALAIILKKHSSKVRIIKVNSLPYNTYITSYNTAHIVLDQVYAYDQGFNALEAMAKGKVVFTGAEQEWLVRYNLQPDTIAINALPNVNYLVKKLEWLILNPKNIINISKNARSFIEKEHNYIKIAKQYTMCWAKAITV